MLEVFRPIFFLVGFVSRLFYRVGFSWWLNPLFARWVQNGFAEEIKQKIPFLFGLYGYGYKVVEDPMANANDESMDYICIASHSLIFKFRRWHRENYGIQIAPSFAPTELYDVLDALLLVDPQTKIDRSKLDTNWRCWGNLLEPRFRLLEEAFDPEHFDRTKAALSGRATLHA